MPPSPSSSPAQSAAGLPELDPTQAAAVAAILRGGHHVITGAPGTGLTTTALATFARFADQHPPEHALLLVPTRQRAGAMRDRLARLLRRTSGSVLVRTPASLAYAILRLRASHRGEPAPTLVSGPEQDTVLAELIAGHLAGEGRAVSWPEQIGPQTLRQPAFRAELRDLLMRAAEAGLDGEALAELGERHGRPQWRAAGQMLHEYSDVMALGELTPDRGARYDAATIVDQAVLALRGWDATAPPQHRPRWSLVLHDDYQDATLATARLVQALADDGAAVAVLGDPDRAVQAFRGGQPALLHTATFPPGSRDGALGAARSTLGRSHRHGQQLRARLAALTATLPPLGDDTRRRPVAREDAVGCPVRHLVLPTAAQEVAAIAQELRRAHLHDGIPWSQQAVIVRSGARVGQIRRGLRIAGVPLAAAVPDRPLREEPAVRPFLIALTAVLTDRVRPEDAVALLLSPLGGLDGVSLRTLRRALRQAGAHGAASEELLASVLTTDGDDLLAALQPGQRRAPAAVRAVLDAGREALADDPRSTELTLWAMWERSGLATPWQNRALAAGPAADRADADLDAVVSLFKAAEQFTDRTTGADPRGFLDHLATQDFAADSLAARGTDTETVAVHTAASAAGSEWELVIVAGLQEDAWPDLRIRDTVLGAQHLSDIATERDLAMTIVDADPGGEAALQRWRQARRVVLADEMRSYVSACSRARSRLLLTAVLDTDERPSVFFEATLAEGAQLPPMTPVTAGLDLRGLVGHLRAELRRPGPHASAAAAVLAHLHARDVPFADPESWPDRFAPTSTAPAFDAREPVTVSPSSVERMIACPVSWLLTNAGGTRPSTRAQNVGNLVHEIAAVLPHGPLEQLRAELDRRWHELGHGEAWVDREERARADRMIERLAGYLASHPGEVQTEVGFDVEIVGARLRGQIDRVEQTPAGPRVVDLKTGTVAPSKEAARVHPQLGAYQLAIGEGGAGGGTPAGGSLVYLGTPTTNASQREQPPLHQAPEPEWARELVAATVRTMTAAQFRAQHNPMCGYCPVRTSCPAQPEGARVVP